MDKMQETYDGFPDRYDELINHEDHEGNLRRFLDSCVDWKGKTVYEFGVGTGRLTQYYADFVRRASVFDNSESMIETARRKISSPNVTIAKLDNAEIHTLTAEADIVIEGWSFGHVVAGRSDDIYGCLKYLDDNCKRLAKEKVILIETMGTNVNMPEVKNKALDTMYQFLKERDYKRTIVKTDYKFESCEEAARVLGGFFGEDMNRIVLKSGKSVIPEYTGIWIYERPVGRKRANAKYII